MRIVEANTDQVHREVPDLLEAFGASRDGAALEKLRRDLDRVTDLAIAKVNGAFSKRPVACDFCGNDAGEGRVSTLNADYCCQECRDNDEAENTRIANDLMGFNYEREEM